MICEKLLNYACNSKLIEIMFLMEWNTLKFQSISQFLEYHGFILAEKFEISQFVSLDPPI